MRMGYFSTTALSGAGSQEKYSANSSGLVMHVARLLFHCSTVFAL